MTDIFKLPQHQAHFNEFGYVIIDAHLEKEIDEMLAFIQPHLSDLSSDFYYSLIANDFEENKNIKEKIKAGLQSFYKTHLVDYKSLNESFLVKPANTKDELLLHQDWCYTYEDKFPSLTLWMPLCDVDENNGALFFAQDSHRWFHNLRSCGFPTARISSIDLPADKLQKLVMKKGQVLLFHPATFHGSFPNNTNQHRAVVTSVVLPAIAPYVYFHALKDGQEKNVKVFKLDDDVFLRELKTMAVGAPPSTDEMEQFHYDHFEISTTDLLEKISPQSTVKG
jgi:ectoine hydroxylase-related dioxygenase (phytanoyl-CoA dioxygenase family)